MQVIRVVLAEDHHVIRVALASFLAQEQDIEVVGEVADATLLFATIAEKQPDVLVLDAHMPGHNVLKTAKKLHAEYPSLRILVLSAYARREYVVGLLRAGASGYILKDDHQETLTQGIRAVARNRRWLSSRIMDILIQSADQEWYTAEDELTDREMDILRLMAQGQRNPQIAVALHLTEQTVKNYIRNIFRKLNVTDRVEAVLYALNHGLVPQEPPQDS
jgi:DNA-binding NarL/FixJ family response regulator